jgi:uncharacterized protein (UPF0335 family)
LRECGLPVGAGDFHLHNGEGARMAAAIGDNSTRFAKDQLKAFVERIERLEEEKKTIADDIRDVYAEAKGNGFDVKALRAVIRLRKQDVQARTEHELILETYMNALGMLADTPLGQAAIKSVAAKPAAPPLDDEVRRVDPD